MLSWRGILWRHRQTDRQTDVSWQASVANQFTKPISLVCSSAPSHSPCPSVLLHMHFFTSSISFQVFGMPGLRHVSFPTRTESRESIVTVEPSSYSFNSNTHRTWIISFIRLRNCDTHQTQIYLNDSFIMILIKLRDGHHLDICTRAVLRAFGKGRQCTRKAVWQMTL